MSGETKQPLSMWVIYNNPADYPGKTIARRWEVRDVETPTSDVIEGSLEALQERFESMGLVCLGRFLEDDPTIVETWT